MASSSLTASHLILGVIALVTGLALGGLGPRSEVRVLRDHVAQLEQRDCDGGRSMGREIAGALRGRPWGRDLQVPVPVPVPEPPSGPIEPGGGAPSGGEAPATDGASLEIIGGEGDLSAVELTESMDQIHDALELRHTQARQALSEQARLSESQLQHVDRIVEDMNADLAALADGFVAHIQETGGQPGRRESMLFARDSIDVLVSAEDELWGSLEPGQREGIDDAALDPMSYIDGTVIDALSALDQL